MADPSHPIWSVLRLLILMTALTIILYANASQFDVTELRTIITMFLFSTGIEGATQYARSFKKPN